MKKSVKRSAKKPEKKAARKPPKKAAGAEIAQTKRTRWSDRSDRRTGEAIDPRFTHLPRKLRLELERRLSTNTFGSYRACSAWLKSKGYYISASALMRIKTTWDRSLEALRISTAQAIAVVRETDGIDDKIEKALIGVIQTGLFQLIWKVNRAMVEFEKEVEHPEEKVGGRIKQNVHLNMSAVARAATGLFKYKLERRQFDQSDPNFQKELKQAEAELARAGAGGLSAGGAERIRAALMEMVEPAIEVVATPVPAEVSNAE